MKRFSSISGISFHGMWIVLKTRELSVKGKISLF